ncbi:hypothetical protein H4R19_002422 [Coemansia spiralis]|nr:hypothetical protein H4R19_002422 [Coemansia spiralis]
MVHIRRALWLAAAAVLAASAGAVLCGCTKDIALRITNIYENGNTEFHYDYCEDLKDGRGFTAGIAGFCTGTADAWKVIQEYHKLTGGKDDFGAMDTTLAKLAESGSESVAELTNYCQVWEKLGKSDRKFQQAQDTIRDQLYFYPSQKAADSVGLKLDISRAQLYDTGIEHGTGTDQDGLPALVAETSRSFTADTPGKSPSTLNINGKKVDEIVWLEKFIQIREADLKNPKEKDNQGGNYWAQTTYRTKSYSYMIGAGEFKWGKTVKLLDNDGNPTTATCGIGTAAKTRRGLDGRPIRRIRPLIRAAGPPVSRRARPPLPRAGNVEL